jgi:membrane-associated phospholipid phosphatase
VLWRWRVELLFWAVWCAAIAAFAGLAWWANQRYALPFDERLTFRVQELYSTAWAPDVFRIANRFGDYEVVAAVLFGFSALLLFRGLRFEAMMMLGAGAMSLVYFAVRGLVYRPDELYLDLRSTFDGLHHPTIYPSPDGFPSGHVFGATLVYGLVFGYAARAIPWLPAAWLVRAGCATAIVLGAIAVMYSGAHWASDALGGALLAAIYLLLAWRLDGAVMALRRQPAPGVLSDATQAQRTLRWIAGGASG